MLSLEFRILGQRYWRLCWTFAVISDRKLWNESFTHHAQQQNHGLKDRQARNGGSLEATRNVLLQLDCESLVGFSAIVWNIFWQTKSSETINMLCFALQGRSSRRWAGVAQRWQTGCWSAKGGEAIFSDDFDWFSDGEIRTKKSSSVKFPMWTTAKAERIYSSCKQRWKQSKLFQTGAW